MKKRMLVFALAITLAAMAQAGEMKFDRMSITKAPKVKIAEGRWHMQGGVALTLFPRNTGEKPLDIKANEIVFEWQPGEQPQKVDLTGNVNVEGEIGAISSQTAVLDLAADTLVFTDQVNIDSEQFQGVSASRFTYNLEDGGIEMDDMTMTNMSLEGVGGEAEPADPMLLTVADVKDWQGIIPAIKAQAAADAPSPGKRLISLLPEDARAQFNALAPDAQLTPDMKKDFVGQLNKALQRKDFYDAAAWQGVALPEPVQALVNAKPESGPELIKLNRGLFEAAFPKFVAQKAAQ
ncbi:MAG TPA: hypothetical protein PLM14_00610 [Candidatus Hydrogenedentes bacterium]|nr:hypothetical protein [Candidatus Hydrogenedentota bacterium]HQE81465.1 hypothetical protein [Candidatus Hydrogenedentota bacterium]HQH52906.1 hypothetical protein [Candidatus Hydrogenedentota bacterium]HQM47119.1 hypothetical protein [Candidatus Hydrogenedentota bacterium]